LGIFARERVSKNKKFFFKKNFTLFDIKNITKLK